MSDYRVGAEYLKAFEILEKATDEILDAYDVDMPDLAQVQMIERLTALVAVSLEEWA